MTSTNKGKSSRLEFAKLNELKNGYPVFSLFDGTYLSTTSGLEEIHHTFIKHNQLTERFSALADHELFTIGETGFGAGLNFLYCWQHFNEQAPDSARLHFISAEKNPISPQDWQRALALFPSLKELSEQLTSSYISASIGHQHLCFAEGRIKLTLLMGDMLDTLSHLDGKVDAWFLNGFRPSRNTAMWQPELFKTIAGKSRLHTTYTASTSDRTVSNSLAEAGFSVEQACCFDPKREVIKGTLAKLPGAEVNHPIWFQPPALSSSRSKTAIVIGGGIAGTSTAHTLARRGWQVTLLEQREDLAMAASGNPQGILYAKLSANQTPLSQFIVQGYCYSINLLKQLSDDSTELWQQSGVIQMAINAKIEQRQKELASVFPEDLLSFHDSDELSRIAGIPVDHSGLYFPAAGWVKPAELCKNLASHPNITIKSRTTIESLKRESDTWTVEAVESHNRQPLRFSADIVVVACATASKNLDQLSHLPLKNIRGQITEVEVTSASKQLKTTVCGEGYVAPADNDRHTFGATFDFNSQSEEVIDAEHQQNIVMQQQWNPHFLEAAGGADTKIIGGKAGFRSTTPDYLPVVGAIIDRLQFMDDFAMLRKNTRHTFNQPPAYLNGLYVNAGHGSRGMITGPLSGEVLAAMICGETSPIPDSLIDAMNPARFLIRDMSRNRI